MKSHIHLRNEMEAFLQFCKDNLQHRPKTNLYIMEPYKGHWKKNNEDELL